MTEENQNQDNKKEKQKNYLLFGAIIICGILIAAAIIYVKPLSIKGLISPNEAANKAINFINENILSGFEDKASLLNVGEESGLYKFGFNLQGQQIDSYVTKDGKLLFLEGIDMNQNKNNQENNTEKNNENSNNSPVSEAPKQDKPDVKLFVMSYCPYGLQMQKAFLPVYDLLKDKADMGVYFVNYIMHDKKEIDENLRQYCIQKEQKNKYYNYLSCFVTSGNSDECLTSADIDKNKLNSCVSQTDKEYKITELYNDKSKWLNGAYPRFDVNSDLNEKYNVQGSPTLIINGVVIDIDRSPEKIKEVICKAFNNPPAECSQSLPDQSFSPGFGLKTDSSSGGSCQ